MTEDVDLRIEAMWMEMVDALHEENFAALSLLPEEEQYAWQSEVMAWAQARAERKILG